MKLLYQHAPALPVTQVSLILPRTGVCLDPPARRGVTRLMTRLLFMGAGGLDNLEFNGRLERLGASAGSSLANDHVALRLTTLSENLDEALELFLLAVRHPTFDADELERLRGELLSSWIADREESKALRAQEVYYHAIYAERPTGYLPDGTREGLADCTHRDVQAQYRRLFGGGEPILAVLSDLPREAVQERIAGRIALEPAADGHPYPWDGFAPPRRGGRRVAIVPDAETNTDELVLGAFAAREKSADWHIHRLIAHIFGGDMNSRMFRVIRGERGYSYGASCWYESSNGRSPRDQVAPFSLYTFPAAEHTAEALPLVLALYEELVARGVTESELALARDALVNSHPFKRDTPQKLLGLQLAEALYGVVSDDEAANRAKMEAVTPADVARVLAETHHPEHLQIVLLGDVSRLEPVARRIAGVEELEIRPYPAPETGGRPA